MIVRLKPQYTFGWAVLGLFCLLVVLGVYLVDVGSGGTEVATARFAARFGSLGIATWITDNLGVPFTIAELDAWEARDYILAGLYGTAGLGLVGYGLRDLLVPRKMLSATNEGVSLRLNGWFGKTSFVPWLAIDDVRPGRMSDYDEVTEVLVFTVVDRSGLPDDPWGARWIDDYTLAVPTRRWTHSAETVTQSLRELALQSMVTI